MIMMMMVVIMIMILSMTLSYVCLEGDGTIVKYVNSVPVIHYLQLSWLSDDDKESDVSDDHDDDKYNKDDDDLQ